MLSNNYSFKNKIKRMTEDHKLRTSMAKPDCHRYADNKFYREIILCDTGALQVSLCFSYLLLLAILVQYC